VDDHEVIDPDAARRKPISRRSAEARLAEQPLLYPINHLGGDSRGIDEK